MAEVEPSAGDHVALEREDRGDPRGVVREYLRLRENVPGAPLLLLRVSSLVQARTRGARGAGGQSLKRSAEYGLTLADALALAQALSRVVCGGLDHTANMSPPSSPATPVKQLPIEELFDAIREFHQSEEAARETPAKAGSIMREGRLRFKEFCRVAGLPIDFTRPDGSQL